MGHNFNKQLQFKKVLTSHYNNNASWMTEVRGLSMAKEADKYYTCADDGTLREWSILKKECLRVLNLNVDEQGIMLGKDPLTKNISDCAKLRVVEVSMAPKGNFAAVGCFDGTVRIVNLKSWSQLAAFRHRKACVTDIKFAPNGKYLAVGYDDSWISMYLLKGFKLVSKVKKHSSAITHLDWSTDSLFIRSNCKANELLFFSAPELEPLADGAIKTRDKHWDTCSCVLSWTVQGIYGRETDNPDISSVSRYKSAEEKNSLLAVSDEKGKVLVYKYPCLKKGAGYEEAGGHASAVATVCFSKDGQHLFSVGGLDNCLMQWKITGLS